MSRNPRWFDIEVKAEIRGSGPGKEHVLERYYVPAGRTFRPSDVAERNHYIDKLCEQIYPAAADACRIAYKRLAPAAADILVEEAFEALAPLVVDEELAALDAESADLARRLATALGAPVEGEATVDEEALVIRRARDLARSLVVFWVDLAETDTGRFAATNDVLVDLLRKVEHSSTRHYQAIYTRFGLDKDDGWRLLDCLNVGATAGRIRDRVEAVVEEAEATAAGFEASWNALNAAPAPEIAVVRLKIEDVSLIQTNLDKQFLALKAPQKAMVRELDRISRQLLDNAAMSPEPELLIACRYTTGTTSKALKAALVPAAQPAV
jgi:hypothetical protein